MPSQTEAGKAFEYILCKRLYDLLSDKQEVKIIENSSFEVARSSFDLSSLGDKLKYSDAADAAINHIIQFEPNIENSNIQNDILTIKIASDSEGIKGDVRDVIISREIQNWEIGISAKNNHKAVKHSRLSSTINFGKEWFELSCDKQYFDVIIPIFSELLQLKAVDTLWRNVERKPLRFYIPILDAFKSELLRLENEHPLIVPQRLLQYLIGNKDFYKVIKSKTEVYAFHPYGTLNKSTGSKGQQLELLV